MDESVTSGIRAVDPAARSTTLTSFYGGYPPTTDPYHLQATTPTNPPYPYQYHLNHYQQQPSPPPQPWPWPPLPPQQQPSPPPPVYDFHNLHRCTIVLADSTVRSYFALPPDYNDIPPPPPGSFAPPPPPYYYPQQPHGESLPTQDQPLLSSAAAVELPPLLPPLPPLEKFQPPPSLPTFTPSPPMKRAVSLPAEARPTRMHGSWLAVVEEEEEEDENHEVEFRLESRNAAAEMGATTSPPQAPEMKAVPPPMPDSKGRAWEYHFEAARQLFDEIPDRKSEAEFQIVEPAGHKQEVPSSYSSVTSSSMTYSSSALHRSGVQRVTVSSSQKRLVVSAKLSQSVSQQNGVTMQDVALVVKELKPENKIGSAFEKLKDGLLSATGGSVEDSNDSSGFSFGENESTVSITVVGASGYLAKKIFPALFALYYEGFLPNHFTIFGYARSKMTDAELRTMVRKTLTCIIDQRDNCGEKMKQLLERCFYQSGQYDSQDHFQKLDKKLKEHEGGRIPNRLFYQHLKVMVHPDVEMRVGAHQIFSVLLNPCSNQPRQGVTQSGFVYQSRKESSNTASIALITARLEKLRREKDGTKKETQETSAHDDSIDKDIAEVSVKQGNTQKSSPNFYKIRDNTAGPSLTDREPYVMKFSEDQVADLLSAFWMQVNLPDNLPSNFEAIAHSFMLMIVSSHLKSPNGNLLRSILVLSVGLLMFADQIYHIAKLNDVLKSLPLDVDPYLGISDDLQVFLRPEADIKKYGSIAENQLASSLLSDLGKQFCESDNAIREILVQFLSDTTEMEAEAVAVQLSESFVPDDAFIFGPQAMLDYDRSQTRGLSKILVIADKHASPVHVAADLLSQAEHGPDSQVVLVIAGDGVDIEAIEECLVVQGKHVNHVMKIVEAHAAGI